MNKKWRFWKYGACFYIGRQFLVSWSSGFHLYYYSKRKDAWAGMFNISDLPAWAYHLLRDF